MEKLKKHLQDTKVALHLAFQIGAIDQSAYKTFIYALDEALKLLDTEYKESLLAFCEWHKSTDFNSFGASSEDCVWTYLYEFLKIEKPK